MRKKRYLKLTWKKDLKPKILLTNSGIKSRVKITGQTGKKWPDKEVFYKGREPHGALLTTYVNDAALKTIINKKGPMPSGATIITENYTPDKTLDSITRMHKIEGFNPKVNDWFWVKFGPDGKIVTAEKYGQTLILAGKVAACIECHGGQTANDYIFTSPLREEVSEVKQVEKEIFDAEKRLMNSGIK